MLPQEYIDRTISDVKDLITRECPWITQSAGENQGVIVLHFHPKYELPRVTRITREQPRYDKGRVYLERVKPVVDEENLSFALDLIETKLFQGRMIAGSISFHFCFGTISNIETESSRTSGEFQHLRRS
jgi:hypothetical protein